MPHKTNPDQWDDAPKDDPIVNIAFLIAVLITVIILLSSCAKLKYGNVISKEYIPAHNQMMMMPMMVGKTTTMMPMFFHYSEQFKLTIYGLSTKGKYITKNIYVPSSEYDTVKIGSFICLDGLCDEPIRQEIKKHK